MKLVAVLATLTMAGCFIQQPAADPTYGGGGGGGAAGDPYAGEGAADPATQPHGPVSVTIRSSCGQTMRVFFGSDPRFGSGTHSTISSNSVSSYTFQPGDMFWITDDSDNGIASVTVSEGTRQIEIDSSCSSLHEN
jgi:hypothetical protein